MKKTVNEIALEAFCLAGKDDSNTLLTNILTTKEKIVIGRRLLIAQAIIAGKTRMEINELIHVSPNTFTQINRWLASEQKRYTSAHSPIKISRKHISRRALPGTYQDMKRRYPGHFLLFTLIEELWKLK